MTDFLVLPDKESSSPILFTLIPDTPFTFQKLLSLANNIFTSFFSDITVILELVSSYSLTET